jgi:glycosyltransferase involved in cell wall biosynthesis
MTVVFSCILPTYNRCDVVEETLRRLLAVDYPDGAFEILVADNSSDGTPEMVERVARTARTPVRLLSSNERLPAVKRNQAAQAAVGEFLLFMNDDVWVRPDFLREHERTQRAHAGEPIAVLGHVEQSPRMDWTPFIEWYTPFAYGELANHNGEAVGPRYFWSINISLPKREMVERNLWFHEDWAEIGHEDVELGYRWAAAGRRIFYNADAWGEHFHPHSLDSACRLQEVIGRGLRDLEALADDPGLLERYGVFSWHNSPRAIVRGLGREALFNRYTVPYAQRWLNSRDHNSELARWMYWKVLLHHTNVGYRSTAIRRPARLAILPPVGAS